MAPAPSSSDTVSTLRSEAEALFARAVAAADPARAAEAALARRRAILEQAQRTIVVGFGKAACPMVEAALGFLGEAAKTVIALTDHGNLRPVKGAIVIGAGHPIPDEAGVGGAAMIEAAVREAKPGDLVLVLVSGGGSALLCAPPAGLTLADKIALNDLLIRSGADIREINAVRSAVSRLKGGRLAALAGEAHVLALVLSDVPGDDVSIIASGPTAPPRSNAAEAHAILERRGLIDKVPDAVRRHLERSGADRVIRRDSFADVENIIVGSNRLSLRAALAGAREKGFAHVELASEWLEGDVSEAATRLHEAALRANQYGRAAILAGGETTVLVTGSGKGGRNQELALRFAMLCEEIPLPRAWVFLSGGTDGRDGPTDAAGAVVDPDSLERMRRRGVEPAERLANSDSYVALAASGDLLKIGVTGTNVADIQILLLA